MPQRRPAIAPRRWRAPSAPARARQTTGEQPLGQVRLLGLPSPSEDVVIDASGRLLAGLEDGRIVRVAEDGRVETLAHVGGRPLGLEVAPDGRILVCEPSRGVLAVDADTRAVEPIADSVAGTPMRFCSNAVLADDGTLYFTDSTTRFGFDDNYAEVLEHSCTGRLLRLSSGGAPEVLLDGLAFANGLALAADDSFVLVVETFEYRVTRLWLTGPRAGTSEPFLDNLPGIPDNMSRGSDGLFWIALSTPRNPALDRLIAAPGALRQAVYRLPAALRPKPVKTVWVIAADAAGRIVRDLQAPGDTFSLVTGVCERDGTVALASLDHAALATFAVV